VRKLTNVATYSDPRAIYSRERLHEFVRLVLTPSQTERLESIIREVRRIPDLESQRDGMETVRNMVTVLQNEAEWELRPRSG